MQTISLENLIESLVVSIETGVDEIRRRHMLRQAVFGLVRQAQVEQMA
jgi:hypothetical protein